MGDEAARVEGSERLLGQSDLKNDWEKFLKEKRLALEEYAKVIGELEAWYKRTTDAIFARAEELRKPHDEWLASLTNPLMAAWTDIQKRLEDEHKAKRNKAQAEYDAAFARIQAQYRAEAERVPLLEPAAMQRALGAEREIFAKKAEALAKADAWQQEELAEPQKRHEKEMDRCQTEYAKRTFAIGEWSRLAEKAAKGIKAKVTEIAEAKRDAVLQSPEMIEEEQKFLDQIGNQLEMGL